MILRIALLAMLALISAGAGVVAWVVLAPASTVPVVASAARRPDVPRPSSWSLPTHCEPAL